MWQFAKNVTFLFSFEEIVLVCYLTLIVNILNQFQLVNIASDDLKAK